MWKETQYRQPINNNLCNNLPVKSSHVFKDLLTDLQKPLGWAYSRHIGYHTLTMWLSGAISMIIQMIKTKIPLKLLMFWSTRENCFVKVTIHLFPRHKCSNITQRIFITPQGWTCSRQTGYQTLMVWIHRLILSASQTTQGKSALDTALFMSTGNFFSRLKFTCDENRRVQISPNKPSETPRVERSVGV